MKQASILVIDQGTTSSRAIIFDINGKSLSVAQQDFSQHFPQPGWVEHDAEEIWQSVVTVVKQALAQLPKQFQVACIGISNQRETTLLWDKQTGECIYPAIVWQDRRSATICQQLQKQIAQTVIQQKTGLLLDPYFSASKIYWLLQNIPQARQLANAGRLCFGTIDTFLLWRLTAGAAFATDVTNASRTLLYNIVEQQWDEALLALFAIPAQILPQVKSNATLYGHTQAELFGQAYPITSLVGDQQAALFGQACFFAGMSKVTYGTGGFIMLNTGENIVYSEQGLLSTIAYQIPHIGVRYAVEGSIFIAGAAIQWLRDQLHLLSDSAESEEIAASIVDNGGVYFIPAFTGLGAPHWDANARGAIVGLSRGSGAAHIVRAALESVAYQTRDLLSAMQSDAKKALQGLRVDGGMAKNTWLMQFLSDTLQLPIQRPKMSELTAMGAAWLAGLGHGIYQDLTELTQLWQEQDQFHPQKPAAQMQTYYQAWQSALQSVLNAHRSA